MDRWAAWSRGTPGGLLWHPVAVLAVAMLAVNDHFLKQVVTGPLTGKISDFAGLVFFPLLLVAALELVAVVHRRPIPDRVRTLWFALGASGTVFSAIKVWPTATDTYNAFLGAGQWLIGGGPLTSRTPMPTAGVTDPTDLVAIPALAIAYWVGSGHKVMPASARLSPVALAALIAAGLLSLATSPAMRSSSVDYEEEIQLTRSAPVAVRNMVIDVTNRDPQLSDLDFVATATSETAEGGMTVIEDTPGVHVSLIASSLDVTPSRQYLAPALSLVDACRADCRREATVIIRLLDPAAHPESGVAAKLTVDLGAQADEEGTGPVDIDLSLTNDPESQFNGIPATATATRAGHVHVGADGAQIVDEFEIDAPQIVDEFEIVIDAAVLAEPLGYPLVAEVFVRHENKTAVGHPNALSAQFSFDSPARPPDAYWYWADVGTGWLDEPPPAPVSVDVLPLCLPAQECRISVTLEAIYEAWYNEPEESGAEPVAGSIDFDWYLEARLEAYDGRALPEGSVRIEPAN